MNAAKVREADREATSSVRVHGCRQSRVVRGEGAPTDEAIKRFLSVLGIDNELQASAFGTAPRFARRSYDRLRPRRDVETSAYSEIF